MIEIVDKKFFKKRVTVWFPEDGYVTKQHCDVCCYVGVNELHDQNNQHISFNSLITDLTVDENELQSVFSKVNRYDIRRSNKDSISIKYYLADEIINNDMLFETYKNLYEKMYHQKGFEAEAPLQQMKLHAKNNAVCISEVQMDGEPIVYHTYVIDGSHARLWMSCSSFRDSEDKQYRALLGRANKRLHFEDMKYFKNFNYTIYDWGGISSFDNPNGIDLFKMSFGGKPITYYDETVLMSWKYKLFFRMKELLTRK